MNFSQKIYYNDVPLILTTDSEAYINDHPAAEDYIFFKGGSVESFARAIKRLEKPGTQGAIIEDSSADALLTQLHTAFHIIDAAGGLVYNEANAILMIYRRGKWDLPKGKLDEDEKIEACALREVSEETGLRDLVIGDKICNTYHTYTQKNDRILKRTAWYKMKGSSADVLRPQKEEDILEAKWVSEHDLAPLAAQSYEAVREVLMKAGLKW